MSTTRRPRSETQAETRDRLLDAAERLFDERGFHRSSVAEIARSAGYTSGAIYANFDRKEELAVAVLERSLERDEQTLVAALAQQGDLAGRLRAILRWRRASLPDDQPFGSLRLELWLLALRDHRLRAALAAWQTRVQHTMAHLLDLQAVDLGITFRIDTTVLAAALLSTSDGAAIGTSVDPTGQHEQAFTWTLASLMVRSMDPCPVTDADWPAFLASLDRA